jgi:hypothetical protein
MRGPLYYNEGDTQGTLYICNLGNALGSSVYPRLLQSPSPWARDRTGLAGVVMMAVVVGRNMAEE